MKNKLIIYELNELPKKILEFYIRKYPESNLSKLKKDGTYIKTFTTDIGELHPWTTWPTFYRGIDNRKHKIQFINQEIDSKKKYPPVWEIISEKNIRIGIFGSLQSYPPLENKNVEFYLPDTFSPDNKTYPKKLSTFQNFNLKLVSNNSGTSRNIRKKDFFNFFKCFINSRLSLKTIFNLFIQLCQEIFFPKFKKRRSLLQPVIGFDIFYQYLRKTKPDFCTFFSNHLAGMMHRYWFDLFPYEFKKQLRKPSQFNANSIINSMHIADRQIGQLMKFCDHNSYNLWIAGSMGQEAISREEYKRLFVKNFGKLISSMGLKTKNYKKLPSMYPDFNIRCNSKKNLDELLKIILSIKSNKKTKIFSLRYKPKKNIVNLSINGQPENIQIILKNKTSNLIDFGISIMPDEVGTGYHISEGILMAYGEKSKFLLKNYSKINIKLISPLILDFFNLKRKNYMSRR